MFRITWLHPDPWEDKYLEFHTTVNTISKFAQDVVDCSNDPQNQLQKNFIFCPNKGVCSELSGED